MRDRLSRIATKSVRESSTGMKFKAANPSNDATPPERYGRPRLP
jgi:hypothetical protein